MLVDRCSASAKNVRSSLGYDPHATCLAAVSSWFRQELAGMCALAGGDVWRSWEVTG